VITHLHGQTAGAHVFRDLCARRGVRLIEDAAQAFGAIEKGRRLGTIGDVGIYSFGFFKNLSTWQGGMVVSNDLKLIERIRARVRKCSEIPAPRLVMRILSGMILDVGTSPPLFSTFAYPIVRRRYAGVERRLDPESRSRRLNRFPSVYLQRIRPWQASVGLRQFDRVDADTAVRIDRARQYHEGLAGLHGIMQPPQAYDGTNIFTYFPIQIHDRERLLKFAYRHGRDFAAQHLKNCADLPGFDEYRRDCPNARAAAGELVLLPTYPRYPASEVKRTVEVLREFVVDSSVRYR
jgi:perosamine synthetase